VRKVNKSIIEREDKKKLNIKLQAKVYVLFAKFIHNSDVISQCFVKKLNANVETNQPKGHRDVKNK